MRVSPSAAVGVFLTIVLVTVVPLVFGGSVAAAPTRTCPTPVAPLETMIPTARPNFRLEKQQWLADQLRQRRFITVALGDSIMEGWPLALLDQATGGPAINAGFGQDGTEQVLWRLRTTDWRDQSPQRVLLLVGTNDLRFDACAIYQGILTVVAQVRRVFPSASVVVTAILPRGNNLLEHDQTIAETNALLNLGAESHAFRFFNPHDAFLCNHQTPCALFQPGNLHLTAEGYGLLSRLLATYLRPNGEAP